MRGALLRHGAETEQVKVRFDDDELAELDREAKRQGRTRSWIVRAAVQAGMPTVRKFPGVRQ